MNIDIRTTPPDHQEMREVLTHLKNGKAANDIPAVYFKYAAQSEKLNDEMVRLYTAVIWKKAFSPNLQILRFLVY